MTADALEYFSAKLAFETDASDVYAAQKAGEHFVLVDVRSAEAWSQGRIVGAVHLPRQEIAARAPHELDPAVPVVVYCWSPGCNAGTKAAIEFARLGFTVKEMIGGYEYWVREGQPTEGDDGALPRVFDPQVMVVRTRVAG
jgi:rhodanese-related sulfurtransferase